ncbi:MAG: dGTPase, partial [Dokdonia sp.]
ALIKNLIDEVPISENASIYQELMAICNCVSVMTDSKSLRIFQKIKGLNVL